MYENVDAKLSLSQVNKLTEACKNRTPMTKYFGCIYAVAAIIFGFDKQTLRKTE